MKFTCENKEFGVETGLYFEIKIYIRKIKIYSLMEAYLKGKLKLFGN